VFAVIRLRGSAGMERMIRDTLKMLRLDAPNNCVVVPETEDYKGMLERCKAACTWGEINKDVLANLLRKRLRVYGDKRVDEKLLKEITKVDSFEKFSDLLISGKVKLKDFKGVRPVFRLTPPSKGFKSVKEFYPKGDLGYRGEKINELLERMI
jgi:large subunit ribosomal protein L30